MKKIRILYKGFNVPAYINDEGVIGKKCSNTKIFQPIKEFGVRSYKGHFYLTSKTYKESNKDTRIYRNKSPLIRLWSGLKNRSRRLMRDFDIKQEDLILPKYCPILGIKIDYSYEKRKNNSPSVDRVDNSKGYTKDNIVICSWRANRLKNDATFEEIENIYKFMKKHRKKS